MVIDPMWRYQDVREPSDLAVEIPPVRDEFKQPDAYEYALYHVGCDHLHEQFDRDDYFAVRAEEDLRSYREWQDYHAPYAERLASVSNIMEDLCRKFAQHKWLRLLIRSWGCPVSPFADGHDAWTRSNSHDVMFNRFRDLNGRPSPTYQSAASPVTPDLDRIAAIIRAGK